MYKFIDKNQTIESSKVTPNNHQEPAFIIGYLRIWQIVGSRKRGIEPLLPIGRTTFLNGVKSGKYPQPVKLSERTTAWRKSDIFALLESVET